MWSPQVLDVQAQEKDRAKFAILHNTTAKLAEPLFMAKFQGYAAKDLADEYLNDVNTLRKFISVESTASAASSDELNKVIAELRTELQEFLEKPLSVPELEAGDLALAKELSLEFAGAMWASIIPALREKTSLGDPIDPAILLPVDLSDGHTEVLDKVLENGSHFEVKLSELNHLTAQLLNELTATPLVSEDVMYLPAQLKFDVDSLKKHLSEAEYQRSKWNLSSVADMISVQSHRLLDFLKSKD